MDFELESISQAVPTIEETTADAVNEPSPSAQN
jgi:hypothetical protein